MKTLLVFLLGAICGAFVWHLYLEREGRTLPAASHSIQSDTANAVDSTKEAASNAKDSVAEKLREWKLTPDDLKADLARGGEIVRSKAAVAGDKIADARIVTVIKAKYVLDRDLSALDITVGCRDGRVSLTGSVVSPNLVGKAIALALDTNGVTNVAANLVVKTM
jgi:osmotically-inducible protein OsmY